jgi:hypothetical protein
MFQSKVLLAASVAVGLVTNVSQGAAETSIAFQSNRIWISTGGVDDELLCKLNEGTPDEKVLVEMKFGDAPVQFREFSSLLKLGVNRLRCVVKDRPDDAGSCFAFGYEIRIGMNEAGIDSSSNLVHARGASCCSALCARTNPVHDETIWIRK